MDTSQVLESLVRVFPSLPDQSIEEQLVVFDALLNVSNPGQRPSAVQLLRDAAESSRDSARRERLLQAAEAVATGRPCAFTPDGLTAQQAAAAQTVSADHWQEPPPSVPPVDDDKDEAAEEEEEYDSMADAPPKLPHLPTRHFFTGLVVRVAQDFTDTQGRESSAGDLLRLLAFDGPYVLNVQVRAVRLNSKDHPQILENADNAWLQPVPSHECLEDLCEAIDLALNKALEDLDPEEEEDEDKIDYVDSLQDDVRECLDWLQDSGKRPTLQSGPLAAQVFGHDHPITAWIRLLYAAIAIVDFRA